MKYYVIETQTRPDNEVNITTTARASLASALSLYHDRISKMVVTELYPSVSVMVADSNLTVIRKETVNTQYVAPVEDEQTEEE